MIPVMIGSIIGGERYSLKQYASVLAIIIGTCIVSSGGGKKKGGADSLLGVAFIVASLTCDGISANMQVQT